MNETVHTEVPTRVLLVDDDLALVRGLKAALESEGFAVRAINRGVQALETAARFGPDVILLDVMMPGVDGYQVLAAIRGDVRTGNIPVIMLTAADSDAAKIHGFNLGADDYVTKPFSAQELQCRIAAILRRARPESVADDNSSCIPVIGASNLELVRSREVYYAEGIRNFTYVHTADARYLSRLTLGALDQKKIEGFMRVHRSFIVNLEHVAGCGWATRSAYRLHMADPARTEIAVSRALVSEVQHRLGLRD